jgi:hypothetical protein
MFYHQHSVAKALLDLFPNIGLVINKLQPRNQSIKSSVLELELELELF